MYFRLITVLRILKQFFQFISTYSIQFVNYTFSQTGEDRILQELFHIKKRDKLFYIDIGAFHPWYLSNTALFYLSGSSGICIEPNPEQFKKFQRYRKSDINLNIGIANEAGILTYYQFNNPAFNTFSEEKATENNNNGFTRLEELKVEVKLLNEILEQYAGSREIDLLSIDVEGLDYSILDSLDFLKYAPNVICVETYKGLEGADDNDQQIEGLLFSKGYFLYAHTPYNSLFVKKTFWAN